MSGFIKFWHLPDLQVLDEEDQIEAEEIMVAIDSITRLEPMDEEGSVFELGLALTDPDLVYVTAEEATRLVKLLKPLSTDDLDIPAKKKKEKGITDDEG